MRYPFRSEPSVPTVPLRVLAVAFFAMVLFGCGAITSMYDEIAAHEATVGKVKFSGVKVLAFNRTKEEVKGPLSRQGYSYFWVDPGPTEVTFTLRFRAETRLGCPYGKKCYRVATLADSRLKISFTSEAGHVYLLEALAPPDWKKHLRSSWYKGSGVAFQGDWSARLYDTTDPSNVVVIGRASSLDH